MGHSNKLNPDVLSIGASRHYQMKTQGSAVHAWKDLGAGILGMLMIDSSSAQPLYTDLVV